MSGEGFGQIDWDPSVSKSNKLQVDLFQFFFYQCTVYYYKDSCKMIGDLPEVLNLNQLFLKLNGPISD